MGLFDRLSRLLRANLNAAISAAEDPEKILDQALLDMQEDQVQLRQAVAQAMAAHKRVEQQYNQNLALAEEWYRKAQLALQKGEEELAKQALARRKSYADTAAALKTQLDQQSVQLENLRRQMTALESKIAEARTKKDMLKARLRAAKATEQVNQALGKVGTSGAMAAFERMEEKVLTQEARAQVAGELAADTLEEQFKALEGNTDLDAELLALKAQMGMLPSPSASPQPLPQSVQQSELEPS
ncbi:MAG: PspA/IM30 family protein [Gloeomargarita sp. SKYBB_i_bin120]|nr:PspA/IM30 family protein [Gloeomargarita sp. SKYG98]MCS7292324.1 PspA/IM30 family protein [Gloeomargarita sp. SKYB120]MDW8177884.1 PspA/IM30 family protein [Gloeomargarita sp. SKYBB_i_bin120]